MSLVYTHSRKLDRNLRSLLYYEWNFILAISLYTEAGFFSSSSVKHHPVYFHATRKQYWLHLVVNKPLKSHGVQSKWLKHLGFTWTISEHWTTSMLILIKFIIFLLYLASLLHSTWGSVRRWISQVQPCQIKRGILPQKIKGWEYSSTIDSPACTRPRVQFPSTREKS